MFRGPKRDSSDDFIAFVGGSETFGKFVQEPFVELVETGLGQPCLNFGIMNAGVDAFLNQPALLEQCERADGTVVQILGAANMSNRFYTVHGLRNDRFITASGALKALYPDLDFTEFTFTRHLLSALQTIDATAFAVVQREVQTAWVSRMKTLLGLIKGRKVLLWVSRRSPDTPCGLVEQSDDPLFITRDMIEEVRRAAPADFVEVVLDEDCAERGLDGMRFAPADIHAAREMVGPIAHARVAKRLIKAIL